MRARLHDLVEQEEKHQCITMNELGTGPCVDSVKHFWLHCRLFGDDASRLPQGCVQADNIAYCQVLGEFEITLEYANIVEPFLGMRERCPSTGPDYLDRFAASWSC